MEKFLACDKVSFWTMLSLPTLIFRVDKVSLSSSSSHSISLATVCKPENGNPKKEHKAQDKRYNRTWIIKKKPTT